MKYILLNSDIARGTMAVKRSSSATRMLKVFEAIAASQPIGVSALARALEADKSAVQRDLMTLADAGWIRAAPNGNGAGSGSGGWELTPRILTLAHPPHSADGLRQLARPALEHLRSTTGETAYLAVPDGGHFVVIDAAESTQVLRMVPPVGLIVPVRGSATARAILPHLPREEQEQMLGTPVTEAMRAEFAATKARGYAVNNGDIDASAVAMAAAILGKDEIPVGALVLSAPSDRLGPDRWAGIGEQLHGAAQRLSALG